MSITIPAPRGIEAAGRSSVVWVPALANPAAPTLVEINAGVHLSCPIGGFEPSVDQSTRSSRLYCEKQAVETPGTPSYSLAPMRLLDDPQRTDVGGQYDYLDTIVEGAQGFLINRRGLDYDAAYAAAQRVTVYPTKVGAVLEVPLDLSDDGGQKFEVEYRLFVTGKVRHGAVVAGA